MAGEPAALEFRVLGGVEALRNGSALRLGGSRQRALLALLLVADGKPVLADRLIDELWHGKPPAGAAGTLQSYISRLRSALGADSEIAGGASGYALKIPDENVDARRFERLVAEGRSALERDSAARAAERFDRALALWNGAPFGDLGTEGALHAEADRLADVRLRASEGRVEAKLDLGRSDEVIDELESLLSEDPYRERLWRHLMIALYRSGRQADALAAYRRACEILGEELGLEPSDELKRLELAILRHEVPSPPTREERHNLPVPASTFFGRNQELAELERLIVHSRLVTLTGVGGVGKTRLALEAARRVLPDFPEVVFVDLSTESLPAGVLQRVAAALDVREHADSQLGQQIAAKLGGGGLLLVLDNCEHLREACANLLDELLPQCPTLHVLATSREFLGCDGETEYPVSPLETTDAVDLFVARAHAVRQGLPDDERTRDKVVAICSDLDGLPLAIELAAARAKALSLEEIAARLTDRLRFLVSWRRLTTARHRTMREAMDWSYELLSTEEQTLLARLSAFAGGFTLDALERVCLDEDEHGALELVGRLIDASLVATEDRDGVSRYSLLATVRVYAAERLEESGAGDAVHRRHAEWCLALAEEAESQLTGEQQTRWLTVLETEHDNLRAALSHLSSTGQVERLLQLAVSLSRFWYIRGYLAEGRQQLEQAVGNGEERDPALRRRALTAAASLALLQGDYTVATGFAERALAAAEATAEPRYVANALSNLGAIVLAAGDQSRARELLEKAVELARSVGDERIAALAINNLGDQALTAGDYARAEPLFAESLALLRERGDTANVARSLFNLGAVALKLGRLGQAEARLRESLTLAEQAEDKEDIAWSLAGLAGLAAAQGLAERAAVLLGAAGAVLENMGADFKPFERQLDDDTRAEAIRLSGEDAFAAASSEGAAMSLADAVEYARAAQVGV